MGRLLKIILLTGICLGTSFAQEGNPLDAARYRKAMQDAADALKDKNYEKVKGLLDKMEELEGRNEATWNLRGAIFAKQKNWEEAGKCFDNALEINPNFFPALFNVGELKFLQGDYAGAEAYFEDLLKRAPRNELILFKVYLSALLRGDDEKAQVWLRKIPRAGDSPAWFYAQSAWDFKHEQRRNAKRLVANAQAIFGEDKTYIFDETFEDAAIKK